MSTSEPALRKETAGIFSGFAAILGDCELAVIELERCLAKLYTNEQLNLSQSVYELQKLDYLRQVQCDLSTVSTGLSRVYLSSQHLPSQEFGKVLESAKLDETKKRLLFGIGLDKSEISTNEKNKFFSGDVDFF